MLKTTMRRRAAAASGVFAAMLAASTGAEAGEIKLNALLPAGIDHPAVAPDQRFSITYEYSRSTREMRSGDILQRRTSVPNIQGVTDFQTVLGNVFQPVIILPLSTLGGAAAPQFNFNTIPTAHPLKLETQTHSFGATARLTERLQVSVDGAYHIKTATNGVFSNNTKVTEFETKASGFGDTAVTLSYDFVLDTDEWAALHLGASLPTGSTGERSAFADSPFSPTSIFPFGFLLNFGTQEFPLLPIEQQFGSGTYDILLGADYALQYGNWAGGLSADGTIRTGDSDENYALGDTADISVWAAYKPLSWMSISARLTGRHEGKIDLNRRVLQTFLYDQEAANSGGRRLDAGIGVNLFAEDGFLAGQGLAIEYTRPVYEDARGVQMKTEETIRARLTFFH